MSYRDNYRDSQLSAQEYCRIQQEYGVHFEKLSISDRSMILSLLGLCLHSLILGGTFQGMAQTFDFLGTFISKDSEDCCLRLMKLNFEHIVCACSALLSQLNVVDK
jgi:hypothetical protein